jgi:hypothetical protein
MVPVMFSGYGFLALTDLQKGLKMNSQYSCDIVVEEAIRFVIAITKQWN